jgi:hypothetical protein
MVTSPLYPVSRKLLNRPVVSSLSSTVLENKEAGRILLNGTPSKGTIFRYDPYGMHVLESREYPTPVYPVRVAKPAALTAVQASPETKPVLPAAKPALAKVSDPVVPEIKKSESKVAKTETLKSSPTEKPEPICRVVVEFKRGEDIYLSHLDHHIGDMIVVEGDRGHDMGCVLEVLPLKGPSVARVVAYATQKDKDTLASLRKEEAAAVRLCQQRVKEHNLKMKIEDVEFQVDGQKLTIYYSSNCSVDFRQLQRTLFRDFRCRVWLRTVLASS